MLGFSIYPLQTNVKDNENYIRRCHELGFKRMFTSMLELSKDKDEALNQVETYRFLLTLAKDLGMLVFIDVNPEVLKNLGVDPFDLQFFVDLGATGLRLDGMFNGIYESFLTFNDQSLDIEVNGSFDSGYVNSIIDLKGRKNKLFTCHNFYPQRYTALDMECFMACHKRHKELNVHTAAFVTSKHGGKFGPWDINEGLCTIEDHRDLPMRIQAQELFALGIDDVIIGDAFASDDELVELSKLDSEILEFKTKFINDEIKELLSNRLMVNRWDYSPKIARDSMSKSYMKNNIIEPNLKEDTMVEMGTILINNKDYLRYSGEVQVSLDEILVATNKNIVGHIEYDDLYLLKYLKGGTRYKLV